MAPGGNRNAYLALSRHDCWELSDDRYRVLIDPYLTGNPLADVQADAFAKLDAIVITHGHGDHLGDAAAIARRSGASLYRTSRSLIISALRMPGHPLHIGGGRQFPFGHVKLTIATTDPLGPMAKPWVIRQG